MLGNPLRSCKKTHGISLTPHLRRPHGQFRSCTFQSLYLSSGYKNQKRIFSFENMTLNPPRSYKKRPAFLKTPYLKLPHGQFGYFLVPFFSAQDCHKNQTKRFFELPVSKETVYTL